MREPVVNAAALDEFIAAEQAAYRERRPVSARLAQHARRHWFAGVPMHWMSDWPLPFPLVVREAHGAQLVDVDGCVLADFCLGDTGAMFGHSPIAVSDAIAKQAARGLTYMLPSELAARAGELLSQRFGLACWQMTQTASDANRAVLRWARALTGRPKILVFDGCYHGAVEDAFVRLDAGRSAIRSGQIGLVSDITRRVRVVEFNDIAALERELAHEDVACVLAEPVMTNAGMVLPHAGFWEAARALCTRHGALLAIDETHTLSSGPRGHAHTIGLHSDFLVIGKAIAGGVPCAVYGCSAELGARMADLLAHKPPGHSGIGTTLAGNALATAALVACLEHVMTEPAYSHMLGLAARLRGELERSIKDHALPWHVLGVGARTELSFAPRSARTAREALAAAHPGLERALHLALLNRGVLITPFHNMLLVSPATTDEHVALLSAAFAQCCARLAPLVRG